MVSFNFYFQLQSRQRIFILAADLRPKVHLEVFVIFHAESQSCRSEAFLLQKVPLRFWRIRGECGKPGSRAVMATAEEPIETWRAFLHLGNHSFVYFREQRAQVAEDLPGSRGTAAPLQKRCIVKILLVNREVLDEL